MPVTAISGASCVKTRAGIDVLWATECPNVTALTFDANRQVTAITMDGVATFGKIEFEKDTAFLNQEKSRNKTSVNVNQTISFNEPGLSNEVRNALEDLNEECCLIVIVRTNGGKYLFCGISFNHQDDEWRTEDMRTDEGSGNTGADPTADADEFIETLVANCSFYALGTTLVEADIPT